MRRGQQLSHKDGHQHRCRDDEGNNYQLGAVRQQELERVPHAALSACSPPARWEQWLHPAVLACHRSIVHQVLGVVRVAAALGTTKFCQRLTRRRGALHREFHVWGRNGSVVSPGVNGCALSREVVPELLRNSPAPFKIGTMDAPEVE